MDIIFLTEALRSLCNDPRRAKKDLGRAGAKRLQQRMDDLRASACLEDMRHLPGRCHELKGDLGGQLGLDLDGGMRLIIEPAQNPVPRKPDGGLSWGEVTAVRVVAVKDYHD